MSRRLNIIVPFGTEKDSLSCPVELLQDVKDLPEILDAVSPIVFRFFFRIRIHKDRCHPCPCGAKDISGKDIADHQTLLVFHAEPLRHQIEDPAIRLMYADITGDHDFIEVFLDVHMLYLMMLGKRITGKS